MWSVISPQELILNKFLIYNIWHIRWRKPCQLPGWMENCHSWVLNLQPPTQHDHKPWVNYKSHTTHEAGFINDLLFCFYSIVLHTCLHWSGLTVKLTALTFLLLFEETSALFWVRITKQILSIWTVWCGSCSLTFALFFGWNPQTVAYSAQPLCWSGWETTPPPLTGEQYGKMEPKYPEGGPRVFYVLRMSLTSPFILNTYSYSFSVHV